MRVVKCEANHFFDADKYSVCPQCGAAIGSSVESQSSSSPKASAGTNSSASKKSVLGETFGVFKKDAFKSHKRGAEPEKPKASVGSDNYAKLKDFNTNSQGGFANTKAPALNPNSLLGGPMSEKIDTPSFNEEERNPEPVVATPVHESPVVQERIEEPAVSSVQKVESPVSVNEASSENSLLDEIKKVTSDNDGKTVGFFSSGRSSNSGKTNDDSADIPSNTPSDEPVVGWLVCIEGPHIGQCFNIYAGKNSLGRNSSNKIVISKDRTISREKHAWILYEPRKREFFALPGDSSGLTYVDDSNIMQATRLEKWSVIDVGNTRLTLVPLCDADFSWENYL